METIGIIGIIGFITVFLRVWVPYVRLPHDFLHDCPNPQKQEDQSSPAWERV